MQGNGAGPRWIDEHRAFREITLTSAIHDAGKDVTAVRIRQPVVLDLETIPASAFEKPIFFLREVLVACTGLSITAVRLMTIDDFVRCTGALTEMGFRLEQAYGLLAQQMESSLATGPTGSPS